MSSEQLDKSNEMWPDYRGLDSTDPGEAASVDPCVGGEKKGYMLRSKLIDPDITLHFPLMLAFKITFAQLGNRFPHGSAW